MWVKAKKASEYLGVSQVTLRSWARNGKIKHRRTPGGKILYDVTELGTEARKRVVYARVSTRAQKGDLERQVTLLRQNFPEHQLVTDIGSGLSFKRKGFNSLLEQLLQGQVSEIVVTHRDRLSRFGFELIANIARLYNCKLLVLDNSSTSPEQELVQDLVSIIHVFSSRLYGLRKYSDKIKKDQGLLKQDGEADCS
jgi:excisionase family DNA binding protein